MTAFTLSREFLDAFARKSSLSMRSRSVLPKYLDWVFRDIPLKNSVVYDIGGGNGLISFYAAERGARLAVCVEPLGAGSNSEMLSQLEEARRTARNGENVIFKALDLDGFANEQPEKADVIVLHNVVNHLDEAACRKLNDGAPDARASFVKIFNTIGNLLRDGGVLVVADAGRESFWTNIGLRNPFAPTIERDVHQEPEIWQELLEEAGFVQASTRWTPMWSLLTGIGNLDRVRGSRSMSAYYSLGHFVFTMTKPG